MNYLKPALLIALAAVSANATAQQYNPPAQNTGEIIIQHILDQVIGSRYTNNNQYRTPQEQEMFRRADTNRDGFLTQAEVEAYRSRMGYGRHGNERYGDGRYQDGRYRDEQYSDHYQDGRYRDQRHQAGIPVSQVDVNRDGYISQAEAAKFMRQIQRYGFDDYYNRAGNRR